MNEGGGGGGWTKCFRQKAGRDTFTEMLRVVKNMTWRQRVTNEVLYAGLPGISTTVRERCLRFGGHCWRRKNEAVGNLVLWEPKHGKRNVGGQARTFADLLEVDTGSPETACRVRWMTGWAEESEPRGSTRST